MDLFAGAAEGAYTDDLQPRRCAGDETLTSPLCRLSGWTLGDRDESTLEQVKEAAGLVGGAAGGASALGRLASSAANAGRGRSAGLLLDAATKGGDDVTLSPAGRALAKHGRREGSAFPVPSGPPKAINEQGSAIVQDIVENEYRRVSFPSRRQNRTVVDIYDRTGRGVRYTPNGDFVGFLEPPR